MNKEIDPNTHPFLPIGDGNKLVSKDSKRSVKKGMDNDDDYYDEVDPNGTVVATYHVWHHMSTYPPFNASEGWEKYSLEGEVIARGSTKA